jgi:SAM-dependent methyltransferase
VALYEQGDSTSRWEAHSFETDKTQQLVEFVSGLIDSDVNVLDFGCNDGTMLDYVRARGCRTFGVEASAKARSVAELKGHIVKPTLDAFPKEVVFDVACAMDVVEHLYDVPRFLAQIAQRLAVGGVLVLLTGNINSLMARMAKNNWWYIRYPEHVRFPSLRWWRRYSGYRLVKTARVHASRGYVHPPTVGSVKNALERWMRNEYDGMPVLLPDHYVVALTLKRSVGIPR